MRNVERLHERAENMRLNPTFHERKFKERLELAGLFFKSQWVIGNYIVDFLIDRTVIEIDGSSHYEADQVVYDKNRTDYLTKCGYSVVRVRNEHVISFDLKQLKKKGKKPKSGMCPKSERMPSKQQSIEAQTRLAAEKLAHVKFVKEKQKKKYKVIEVTPPALPKATQPRYTFATLKKTA